MMVGMTTKIAVSLPDEQVEAARTAVAEGRAPSVSAYVSEALARRSAEEELLELFDEDERDLPTTDAHRAWAQRALGVNSLAPTDAGRAGPARRRVAVHRTTPSPRRSGSSAPSRADVKKALTVLEAYQAEVAESSGAKRSARAGAPAGSTGPSGWDAKKALEVLEAYQAHVAESPKRTSRGRQHGAPGGSGK